MHIHIPINDEQLRAFCAKWRITRFELFGSVLREDFRPDSDIDVLVTLPPESHFTLFDLAKMANELEDMFGRQVDLLDRRWIEHSHNAIRRAEILTNAREIYHVAA